MNILAGSNSLKLKCLSNGFVSTKHAVLTSQGVN